MADDPIDELFRRKNDELVGAISRRYRDPHGAQDAAQEAWLRILDRPDVIEGKRPDGWLFRVASNETLGNRKKATREAPTEHLDDDTTEGPLDILLDGLEAERALECLDALNDSDRQFIIDLLLRELDPELVAELHGIAAGSIKMKRWRAVKRLRKEAERRGYRDPNTGRALGLTAPLAGWWSRISTFVRSDLIVPVAGGVALTLAPVLPGSAASAASVPDPANVPWEAPDEELPSRDGLRSASPTTADPVVGSTPRQGATAPEPDVLLKMGAGYVYRGDRVEEPTFTITTPAGGVESDDVPAPPEPVDPICIHDTGWC